MIGTPRVVLVVDTFPKIGQTFIVAKFVGLLQRGWDVHVVARRPDLAGWRFFPEVGFDRDRRVRAHFGHDFASSLARLAPDLVHFEFGDQAAKHLPLALPA